jgi:hypothetical protein
MLTHTPLNALLLLCCRAWNLRTSSRRPPHAHAAGHAAPPRQPHWRRHVKAKSAKPRSNPTSTPATSQQSPADHVDHQSSRHRSPHAHADADNSMALRQTARAPKTGNEDLGYLLEPSLPLHHWPPTTASPRWPNRTNHYHRAMSSQTERGPGFNPPTRKVMAFLNRLPRLQALVALLRLILLWSGQNQLQRLATTRPSLQQSRTRRWWRSPHHAEAAPNTATLTPRSASQQMPHQPERPQQQRPRPSSAGRAAAGQRAPRTDSHDALVEPKRKQLHQSAALRLPHLVQPFQLRTRRSNSRHVHPSTPTDAHAPMAPRFLSLRNSPSTAQSRAPCPSTLSVTFKTHAGLFSGATSKPAPTMTKSSCFSMLCSSCQYQAPC